MLFSVEQAFVAWDEIRAPLKAPAWEAILHQDLTIVTTDEERFSSKLQSCFRTCNRKSHRLDDSYTLY